MGGTLSLIACKLFAKNLCSPVKSSPATQQGISGMNRGHLFASRAPLNAIYISVQTVQFKPHLQYSLIPLIRPSHLQHSLVPFFSFIRHSLPSPFSWNYLLNQVVEPVCVWWTKKQKTISSGGPVRTNFVLVFCDF